MTERQFDTGQVVLNYAESEGSRPPLVLLHGSSLWWKYYLPVLPALSARWHTYAVDLRGHGKSGRVGNGYRVENYADDCVALMQAQLAEPAMLVGHSLGGLVALHIASTHPELVRALVLEDPPIGGAPAGPQRANNQFVIFRDLARASLPLEAIIDRLAQLWPDRDMARLRIRARSLQLLDPETLDMAFAGQATERYERDKLLASVSCPVLLLRADPGQSPAVTDADERALRAAVADVSVVPFPGVGHPIQATEPELFRRVVSDFLESLE